MFSAIRRRIHLSPATVIATLALVFAITGGAYAASKVLITSTKQISPKVLKALTGKAGPAGPAGAPGAAGPAGVGTAGPAGPAGTAGANGANGTNGTNGTNGKTVLSGNGAPAGGLGNSGDFYIDTAASEIYGPKTGSSWGPPTPLKGEEGSPWTAGGTLPVGSTETGAWGAAGPKGPAMASISFNVPLAAGLDEEHSIVVPVGDTSTAHCSAGAPNGPGGTVSDPKADSGYLCVYIGNAFNAGAPEISAPDVSGSQATRSGAEVIWAFTEEHVGLEGLERGTWAVTG